MSGRLGVSNLSLRVCQDALGMRSGLMAPNGLLNMRKVHIGHPCRPLNLQKRSLTTRVLASFRSSAECVEAIEAIAAKDSDHLRA